MPERRIVVIDDRPEETRPLLLDIGARLDCVHPQELQPEQLETPALVLIDHHLEDWPERSSYPLSCQPLNGTALAATIQAHLAGRSDQTAPTAVGLFSARLDELMRGIPDPTENQAALATGLDWVFSKRGADEDLAAQPERIVEFAAAVERLPRSWPREDPLSAQSELDRLLGLDDAASWADAARLQVARCYPPRHEIGWLSGGLAMIRWLSQRILPYPTFLLDDLHLAIRLGVTPTWLAKQFQVDNSPLLRRLHPAEYSGSLASFLGRRWWSAGIDALLWEQTAGQSLDARAIVEWIKHVSGSPPEIVSPNSTLVLNGVLRFDGAVAPFTDCVRLQLDDWPPYAEPPWAKQKDVAITSRLKDLVSFEDLDRLTNGEG